MKEGSETASRVELGLKCELTICLIDCRSVMKHTGALNAVRALETVPARDVCHPPGCTYLLFDTNQDGTAGVCAVG